MKVHYLHIRRNTFGARFTKSGNYAHISMGITVAYTLNSEGLVDRYAFSKCSIHDNFCKATGRKIAVSRLFMNPINHRTYSKCEFILGCFSGDIVSFF